MQYVFYDTNNTQLVSNFRPEPYSVDGVTVAMDPTILPGGWVELQVSYTATPVYNPETHRIEETWGINGNLWQQGWNIIALTSEELEARRQSLVPQSISVVQFFRGMWATLGKDRDEIINIINNIADTDERRQRVIDLYHSNEILRNSAFVSFIQNYYGYTDLQIDNFFTNSQSL